MVPGKVSSIVYNDSEGSCFCQSGRVNVCQSGGVPFRTGPVLANPEGSCFANLEGSKLGGSCFYQSVRVNFCQSGGSQFGGVLFLPTQKGHLFPILRGPNSEVSCLSQSGRVIFCQSGGVKIRKGAVFTNPLGFHWNRLVAGLAVYLTN